MWGRVGQLGPGTTWWTCSVVVEPYIWVEYEGCRQSEYLRLVKGVRLGQIF